MSVVVALRKESVDRNFVGSRHRIVDIIVALRKESVDRNRPVVGYLCIVGGSLSARRAWIEIIHTAREGNDNKVALRKESVDRNIDTKHFCISIIRRSPQGERG